MHVVWGWEDGEAMPSCNGLKLNARVPPQAFQILKRKKKPPTSLPRIQVQKSKIRVRGFFVLQKTEKNKNKGATPQVTSVGKSSENEMGPGRGKITLVS